MITIDLTPHEYRFIYGNILQKLTDLQISIFIDGRPNPNIEYITNEIKLMDAFQTKLLKAGKEAVDEQFELERKEK